MPKTILIVLVVATWTSCNKISFNNIIALQYFSLTAENLLSTVVLEQLQAEPVQKHLQAQSHTVAYMRAKPTSIGTIGGRLRAHRRKRHRDGQRYEQLIVSVLLQQVYDARPRPREPVSNLLKHSSGVSALSPRPFAARGAWGDRDPPGARRAATARSRPPAPGAAPCTPLAPRFSVAPRVCPTASSTDSPHPDSATPQRPRRGTGHLSASAKSCRRKQYTALS